MYDAGPAYLLECQKQLKPFFHTQHSAGLRTISRQNAGKKPIALLACLAQKVHRPGMQQFKGPKHNSACQLRILGQREKIRQECEVRFIPRSSARSGCGGNVRFQTFSSPTAILWRAADLRPIPAPTPLFSLGRVNSQSRILL